MTEQNKASAPSQEHPYPQPVIQYPQPYNGAYPPPPPGAAPYPYFYPPPAEGSHPENGQNGMPPGPYMMIAPPGMVYVHPPQPQGPSFQSPTTTPPQPTHSRPKRKQVKMACTNCAAACKRCDENRPCERCTKYGISESCIDGQRKERKKGIKRGPYKRKNKGGSDSPGYSGEWAPGSQPPPSNASNAAAAMHAVTAQLNPEGYYPPPTIFYPPPYLSHPPEGQPGPDGSPSHINGQPSMMPYYIHPGAYPPPYGHYPAMYPHPPPPHPGAPAAAPPPPGAPPQTMVPGSDQQQPPQTVNPADTSKKDDLPGDANGTDVIANGRKRSRASRTGEPKSKRAKPSSTARNGKEKEGGDLGAAEEAHDAEAGETLA